MKILTVINISNTDDLSCDSGVIFQRILSEQFQKQGIIYQIIGPDIKAFREAEFFNAKKHYIALGTSRYESRFSFDWRAFKEIIDKERPDLIFNNQIELTSAIRSLCVTLGQPLMPIVSYCHYPALWSVENGIPELDESLNHQYLGLPIVFNILSAMVTADSVIVQSQFAKDLLLKSADYYRIQNIPDLTVIPPPADPLLFDNQPLMAPKIRSILYNHRLYKSYGTEEFLQFIDSISDLDFELLVSDPMPNRSSARSHLSSSPGYYREKIAEMKRAKLFNGNVQREEYKNIVKKTRLSFGAFRKACVWSMASVDCMTLGIPVIAPNYAAYPEFVPSTLLFKNLFQASTLTDRLLYNDVFWMESSDACYKLAQQLHPSVIAERFIHLFQTKLNPSLV